MKQRIEKCYRRFNLETSTPSDLRDFLRKLDSESEITAEEFNLRAERAISRFNKAANEEGQGIMLSVFDEGKLIGIISAVPENGKYVVDVDIPYVTWQYRFSADVIKYFIEVCKEIHLANELILNKKNQMIADYMKKRQVTSAQVSLQ